jgi:hypothetical protein
VGRLEFVYNNGCQASLKMRPFKALYRRKSNGPLSWDNPVDRDIIGPYLLKEMEEKMARIRKNLKVLHDRHKSYTDKNIFFTYFKVGKYVFLKVKAKRRFLRLSCCPKLAAIYCGPFEIL